MRAEPVFAAARSRSEAAAARAPDRKDMILGLFAFAAAGAIAINALFLQSGPHPAPFFAAKRVGDAAPPIRQSAPVRESAPIRESAAPAAAGVALPRPRPAELEAMRTEAARLEPARTEPVQPQRPVREVTADIQAELARRGFYEGPADGIYGARTDAAIRDFEQAAGVKIGQEPNEAMLRLMRASGVKAAAPPAAAPHGADPIAEIIAPPPRRVIAVQRALADYGYGQIRPSGQLDRETQDAIEQFERARKLPVTRQVTPALLRELNVMSGRPIE